MDLRRLLFVVISLLFLNGPSGASVIYVDVDAMGSDDGSSWSDAFVDLQDALAMVEFGDEIWVAEGTYKPTDGTDRMATFQLVDGVQIYGGFGGYEASREQRDWQTNETILSGDIGLLQDASTTAKWEERRPPRSAPRETHEAWFESKRLFIEDIEKVASTADNSHTIVWGVGVGSLTVLDGFTVSGATNGDSDQPGALHLERSRPIIRNVRIAHNSAEYYGAGAYVDGGAPTFENVHFSYNHSIGFGGAMMLQGLVDLTFVDTVFEHNFDSYLGGAIGGNVDAGSSLTMIRGAVQFNSCDEGIGGVYFRASAEFHGTRFEDNRSRKAESGTGALWVNDLTLDSCLLLDNWYMAEISIDIPSMVSAVRAGDAVVHNSVFTGNQIGYAAFPRCAHPPTAGGPLFVGGLSMKNSTVAGNPSYQPGTAGALWLGNSAPAEIENSILWGNPTPCGGSVVRVGTTDAVRIQNSLVEHSGGTGPYWDPALGEDLGGNIDLDPRFVDLDGGDLHLEPASPAVDSGADDLLPPGVVTDLDGNPRIVGDHVDMGAYELQEDGCEVFSVVMGETWDAVSLQQVLDAEYGVGAIDVETEYEGYQCGDAVEPYWIDTDIDAWLVKEVAGFRDENVLGWHVERFAPPVIDGIDDGVIFEGGGGEGQTTSVTFPAGETRFGFYLNPNGAGDTAGAPEPELFFTNRRYNDAGQDGSGDERPPDGGDPQCLIYNITDLRGGTPTYVLAWEDIDYGSPLSDTWSSSSTDNDFNDLVVEIQAMSPVPAVIANLTARRVDEGVRIVWSIEGVGRLDRLELVRRRDAEPERVVAEWTRAQGAGEWLDTSGPVAGSTLYRLEGYVGGTRVSSEEVRIRGSVAPGTRLARAVPNPFNPSTEIHFELEADRSVGLSIYDLSGRVVRTLVDENLRAGAHTVSWNGEDDAGRRVASGVYLYQLRAGNFVQTRRVLLLK